MSITTFLTGDNSILSFILLIIFFFFYPRLMIWQMTYKLESDLTELDGYRKASEDYVLKKISPKPDKRQKDLVKNFMDFFIAPPVDLDPFGIVKKIEHIMDESERRFSYFVESIAPKMNAIDKANLKFALIGAIGVNQIYKVIRHYIIMTKKTNNLQYAMMLQMLMPMIMKVAKANTKATKAFADGMPIGDAIGPMVAASLKTKEGSEIAKDVIASKENLAGCDVFVLKAKGPGSALGKLGKAVEALHKSEKIDHIITIDAAGKLEGEKTGSIAEGVGVMMGGVGVERSQIEEVAVKYDIPTDGIAIKMAPEEASIPLKKEVFDAQKNAIEILERLVKDTKKKRILIIGVGNTCGIGNTKASLRGLEDKLKPTWREQKKEEEEEKKKEKKWF
ncbi:Uncharacterised protein [uncultured archaeon]|nr:Uncharacterised protein [uncultured archaeon]